MFTFWVMFWIYSASMAMGTQSSNENFEQSHTDFREYATGNRIVDGLIPTSQIPRSQQFRATSKQKEEHILDFFKTPERLMVPLGFYALEHDMGKVNVLRVLQQNHFNLVHKYHGKQTLIMALHDLETARAAGVGVLQNLPSSYLKRDTQFWKSHISALASHEQLLVWYLPEEVPPDDLSYLRRIATIIRQMDTLKRPLVTYVNNYVNGYWEAVAEFADALVFGLYPILYDNAPRANGRRILDKAHEVGVSVVFKAVEAYEKNGRYTRPEEVRFDTYLALISGAKGILYYCYARAHKDQQLMNEIFELAEELNGSMALGEVFLEGNEPNDVQCHLLKGDAYAPPATAFENRNRKIQRTYSSIQWTSRVHKGSLYIFAVNMNQKVGRNNYGGDEFAVEVAFSSKKFRSTLVEVLFENRSRPIEDGRFSDNFVPIGTHIYRLRLE